MKAMLLLITFAVLSQTQAQANELYLCEMKDLATGQALEGTLLRVGVSGSNFRGAVSLRATVYSKADSWGAPSEQLAVLLPINPESRSGVTYRNDDPKTLIDFTDFGSTGVLAVRKGRKGYSVSCVRQ